MKKYFFLVLIPLALMACKGGQKAGGNKGDKNIPAEAFQAWMHSHEESSEAENVYRPVDYEFPPSRGRQGWELKADGTFIHTRIGPTDRPTPVEGKWVSKAPNELEVSFPGTEYEGFTVKIISVTKDLMKVAAN